MRRVHLLIIAISIISISLIIIIYFTSQKRQNNRYVLSAGQEGGSFISMADCILEAISSSYPKIKVSEIKSQGSVENIDRLLTGEADLALIQNDTRGNSLIRTLVPLHREVLHFLVRRDSQIYQIRDLKGRTVEVGPKESGTELAIRNLLQHYGINSDIYNPVYNGISKAAPKLLSGEIDAMLVIQSLNSETCRNIIASGKVRFVGLGEAGTVGSETEGFCLEYPFVEPYVIPIYSYLTEGTEHPGEPLQPIPTLSYRAVLVCHKDLPHGIARNITQAIFSNRLTFIDKDASAALITEGFDPSKLQFPLHQGAITYYERNNPGFLRIYAEVLGFILSFIIAMITLIIAFRKWVVHKKKNRIDRYYLRLDTILSKMREPDTDANDLRKIETELVEIRHNALRELANEKLMANESFTIFQSLLSECQQQVQSKLTV